MDWQIIDRGCVFRLGSLIIGDRDLILLVYLIGEEIFCLDRGSLPSLFLEHKGMSHLCFAILLPTPL